MQAVISNQDEVFSRFLSSIQSGPDTLHSATADPRVTSFSVFVVEANLPLARLLASGLSTDFSSVDFSHDLVSGLRQFEKLQSELLIIDLDLPGLDAPALIRGIRGKRPEVRILATSVRDGIEDLVTALDNGADDYLSKPFSLLELMARVRAIRRRSQTSNTRLMPKTSNLVLHRDQCRVERDGRLIDLTPREFSLLEYLVQNSGKTLSRAILSQEVWNMPIESNTNIVDVYIKYLRDKLDGDNDVKLIRTVRGMGYSYQAQA